MNTESVARYFEGRTVQIEGYKVKTEKAIISSYINHITFHFNVSTLAGNYLLKASVGVDNVDKLSVQELYTEISNQIQEAVGSQTTTNIELARYFKEDK